MKTDIRLPGHFKQVVGEALLSNKDASIDYLRAMRIMGTPFFGTFAAWNYFGKLWWNDDLGYWCVEIWKHRDYQVTHLCETLDELFMKYG